MHWNWLSPLGNAALLWPLLLATAWQLGRQSHEAGRKTRPWLLAMAGASVLVTACKITFYGWGTGVRAWNLTGPSGHAMLAMAFWPAFLALLVPAHRPGHRRLAVATGVLFALACGVSRGISRVHPWPEVALGLILGGAVALVGLHCLRGESLTMPRPRTVPALLLIGAFIGLLGPVNLPTERWLARAGARIAGREQPIKRREWRSGEASAPIEKSQPE